MTIDNPAAARQDEGHFPPPAQLTIRQTMGIQHAGFLMLVPPLAPRYLLVPDAPRQQLRVFDLLQPSGPGVAVLHGKNMPSVFTAAVSPSGDSIFLGFGGADYNLKVYDTNVLLTVAAALLARGEAEADHQTAPRAWAPSEHGFPIPPSGAAFSQDAARLFVLYRDGGGITVHDTEHPNLPVLRTLTFRTYGFMSNYMLACNGMLLAAAAGGGEGSTTKPTSAQEAHLRRQVQLWRLEPNGETELWTINNPDLADCVAVRPDGMVAVGLRNGMVRLLARDDVGGKQDVAVELEPPDKGKNSPMVQALCFSHDGSKLVAGRSESDDFVVYDVASAVAIHRFVHPKSTGCSAAFFPAGDVLVTGTRAGGAQQCIFHRLLPPAPRLDLTMSTSTNIASINVTSGGKCGSIVAMAAGSEVEVVTEDGEVLLKKDLGIELLTSYIGFRPAVLLQPGGKFVVCLARHAKTAVVLSVADGSERLRTAITSASGAYWCPNGALLALVTNQGVRFFSTQSDFVEVQHLENGKTTNAFAFDSTGARVATGNNTGSLIVWNVATWTPIRTFDVGSLILSVCFSKSGDRIAFHADDDGKVGVLSLEAESDAEPLVVFSQVNAFCDMQFSPDDNFLLCCPSMFRTFDQHRMRVLDLSARTDAEWGDLLRTMALPVAGGMLYGRNFGWAQLSHPQSLAAETADAVVDAPWLLYGAVGKRLVAVGIQEALYAIEDNAWTTEQLVFCSEHQQKHVGLVVESAPHCTNIQAADTGETVLHCLTRTRQVESLQIWLSACPSVSLVADGQRKTAIEVAMQLNQIDAAQALWQKLPPSTTSIAASLLLQDLWSLSKTHPDLALSFLLDVEPCIVRTLATFRTELARPVEVCGLPTATLVSSSNGGESTSESEDATDQIPSIWADKCPVDSPKMLVASRVVVLPGFLGDADSSPFHDIVTNCDATVFESKLLQLIVQYKWEENVRSQRIRSVALYGIAFVIGAVAMISGAKGTSSHADLLQGLTVVIEVSSLGFEAFELAREGCATYFTGPWNILDVVSSSLLLYASACYFERFAVGVRTAGALGVSLKCFGMVDYLRSFPATGSLVRMILVIITDMVPFMTILSFAMLGCMLFFAINLSSSLGLDSDDPSLFRTLVTVYHMTLGIGAGIDTQHASVTTVMVVTLFMSFVVVVLYDILYVLNLLIAIMGDSYEKVKESERVEAIRERAMIIVEEEKRFPKSHRYHNFMHFVEAADSTDKSQQWEGMTRRVTEMVTARTDRLEHELGGELAQIKSQMDEMGEMNCKFEREMNCKFELLDSKFEVLDSKLDMLLDRLK